MFYSKICEQSFKKIIKTKETTRKLSVFARLCYFKILDDERNTTLVTKRKSATEEMRPGRRFKGNIRLD